MLKANSEVLVIAQYPFNMPQDDEHLLAYCRAFPLVRQETILNNHRVIGISTLMVHPPTLVNYPIVIAMVELLGG